MTDFIIIAVLVLIIGAAVVYIIKEKKKGVKCIGCPAGGSCLGAHKKGSGCNGSCGSCSSCSGTDECGCHTK